MKRLRSALLAAALSATPAVAQMPRFDLKAIDRPAETGAIPLYPVGALPEAPTPERWGRLIGDFPDGMRMDARVVRNVAVPTVTPVLPDPAKATGAAVVVAPGGAFLSLSMDSGGFAVAHRLADRGIAAFVLKYRLNATPADDGAFMRVVGQTFAPPTRGDAKPRPAPPQSIADALQALKLIRTRAREFRVDPTRVGMIGFSAGAQTALETALAADAAARPAFVGFVYGPMRERVAPAGAPPLFAAIALDDGLFGAQGFGIIEAWRRAGAPVELHAYERGDHGFGVGKPGTTTVGVIDQFTLWLRSRGLLGAAK